MVYVEGSKEKKVVVMILFMFLAEKNVGYFLI